MAKPVYITPVNGCIRYKGENILPGTPFQCDGDEAKRLIGMGVAEPAVKPVPAQTHPTKTAEQIALETAAAEQATLLEKISAAATAEELAALMPENEPAAEVTAAFEARMEQLTGSAN